MRLGYVKNQIFQQKQQVIHKLSTVYYYGFVKFPKMSAIWRVQPVKLLNASVLIPSNVSPASNLTIKSNAVDVTTFKPLFSSLKTLNTDFCFVPLLIKISADL